MMLGAAIGDIVGSRFEFANHKSTEFTLFHPHSNYTDDTICTVAVAEWVLNGCEDDLAATLQRWCRRYPNPEGAYGARFSHWIDAEYPLPYGSWGNGSAMRVSAVGWAFDNLPETLAQAAASAAVTHNHPEGIKGAQAVAAVMWWARQGQRKGWIRQAVSSEFGYDLSLSCAQIRPDYRFDESCQGTVPQAITAFLEARDFEHAIRLAVSLGGDSDTLAAITGAMAEAAHPIPRPLREAALVILPRDLAEV